MSPLWSDMALARAALDNAADRGIAVKPVEPTRKPKELKGAVRRVFRPRLASLAL